MRYRQLQLDWRNLLAVAIFGALGGLMRYGIGLVIHGSVATIVVNLSGSFILALITYWLGPVSDLPTWAITGLGTGMIGAFTTFSTFTLDSVHLLASQPVWGVAYLAVSLVGGFVMAVLGYLFAQKLRGGADYD